MWCNLHKLEYDPGILSVGCPHCKREREQQEENKRAQEDLLFEGRRQSDALQKQNELLEKIRLDNQEQEWERQAALDRIAASEQQRLEEEREFRRADELRARLRMGLSEFPLEFQERWRLHNEKKGAVEKEEQVFAQERARLVEAIDKRKAALAKVRKRGHNRASDDFNANLTTAEGQRKLSALPHGRIDGMPNFLLASQAYKDILGSSFVGPVTPSIPRELPADTAPTLHILKLIEEAVERAKPLEKKGGGFYGCLGVILFFLSCVVLTPVFANSSNVLPVVFIVWLITIGGPIFIWKIFESKRKQVDADLRTFLTNAAKLASSLSNALPADYSSAGSVPPQSSVIQSIKTARESLSNALLIDYFETILTSTPEAPEIRSFESEIQAGKRELLSLEERFDQSRAARDDAKHRYSIARREILRVGQEVFEGIRAQGRVVELAVCNRCSEYMDNLHDACPYCGYS